MANVTSSVVVGALGGVVGAGVSGTQKEVPMEVERDVGSVHTPSKPGPLG